MRVFVRIALAMACLVAGQTAAFAQATISGLVKDSSGGILPGATVEAASPALIEKATDEQSRVGPGQHLVLGPFHRGVAEDE